MRTCPDAGRRLRRARANADGGNASGRLRAEGSPSRTKRPARCSACRLVPGQQLRLTLGRRPRTNPVSATEQKIRGGTVSPNSGRTLPQCVNRGGVTHAESHPVTCPQLGVQGAVAHREIPSLGEGAPAASSPSGDHGARPAATRITGPGAAIALAPPPPGKGTTCRNCVTANDQFSSKRRARGDPVSAA